MDAKTSAGQSAVKPGLLDRLQTWFLANWDAVLGWAVCVACGLAVLHVLHLNLVFRNTTAAGGDTGAHVWFPAYMQHHLLPKFRLAGWSPDYYAGFPAGQFYFPVPALLVIILNIFMPYNVAFKIITIAGPILLPTAAYIFGRGIRAARPTPELFAVAMVLLEFFKGDPSNLGIHQAAQFNERIMGITLASNLAGTYSFTLAVVFALIFLGTFARALDEKKRLALPAFFFAAAIMSHLVVGLFAVIGAILIFAFYMISDKDKLYGPTAGVTILGAFFLALWTLNSIIIAVGALCVIATLAAYIFIPLRKRKQEDKRSNLVLIWPRLRNLLLPGVILLVGGFITAVWSLPLKVYYSETASMRYEKLNDNLFKLYLFPSYLRWVIVAAVIAVVIGVVLARRSTLIILAFTVAFGLVFVVWPEGKAWNLRYLPFWYLGGFFLAACGFGELCRLPASVYRWVAAEKKSSQSKNQTNLEVSVSDREQLPLPAGKFSPQEERRVDFWGRVVASGLLILLATIAISKTLSNVGFPWDGQRGFVDEWASWNFSGYQDQDRPGHPAKSYKEYKSIMDTMETLPPGRVVWEKATENGSDTLNAYGTDFALMLLPYWTNGRFPSMEGLYFESSATTPYHFLMVAKLARDPADTVRGFPYKTIADFNEGVQQMQMFGVHYYMAQTSVAKEAADANPNLKLVRTVPDLDGKPPSGWNIYQVKDSPLVAGFSHQPVIVHPKSGKESQCFNQPVEGSDPQLGTWECASAPWWEDPNAWQVPLAEGGPKNWKVVSQKDELTATSPREPHVTVTNIKSGDDSVSFSVSRTGVPVVVKVSYYPAWKAHGADGPWRLSPNLMVVVPTSKHVTLKYERTPAEWGGLGLTGVGFVGLVALAVVPRRWPRSVRDTDISTPAG